MKKILVAMAFVAFLGFILSSCKSVEKCPAYSEVEIEHNDSNPS